MGKQIESLVDHMYTMNYGSHMEEQAEENGRINLSKEQHQVLVELFPEPIIVYCGNHIVYINPAGVAMIGADQKSDVVGKDITEFLHPDSIVGVEATKNKFLEDGKPSELIERKLIRLDGKTIIVEVLAIPLVYKGKPAIQFLCRNITVQRKFEQSLIEGEQRYRRMIQNSPQPTVIHKDDIITYMNDAALRLLRVQIDNHLENIIVGKSIFEFIHNDYHDIARKRFKVTPFTQDPNEYFIYKLIGFDGEIFEVEISSIEVKNPGGESYIQSVIRDFTDRRRDKQLLRESAQTYERLIEFLPEPIVVIDKGIIIYLNVSAEKLVRSTTPGQLIGRSWFEFIPPAILDATKQVMDEMMQTNNLRPFSETTLICCDGEHIDVEVSCIRINNYMGNKVILNVIRDLTERKHSQELLVKSEKLSVIGQLAAGVAHEIRNPLTVLRGFTQLLQKDFGKNHIYLSTMLSEIDRINDIVNEFMTLAKPQFVKFSSKYVCDIVNSVVSILETQAILVNVNIKIQYADQIPHIHCDENQLKQVFINVIKNAIEAMPFGGEIDIVVEQTYNNQLLIRICDQGPGIPQEVIQRLGEPFYTTKENGTGLGLMICQRIIEAHQGTLNITSSEAGTNIDILLPVESV